QPRRDLRRVLDLARGLDQARARAEDRLAGGVELLQCGDEVPAVEQLEQRGALAPRHDEPRDVVELAGHPDLRRGHADAVEGLSMEGEVALEREEPDLHAVCTSPAPPPSSRARSPSHSSTVSALRSGGHTGYQIFSMRPPSTYQAMRLMSVDPPPRATGNSNVGSPRARVSARSASLRSGNGTWFRSANSRWHAVVWLLTPKISTPSAANS